jgi:hypothetical protein
MYHPSMHQSVVLPIFRREKAPSPTSPKTPASSTTGSCRCPIWDSPEPVRCILLSPALPCHCPERRCPTSARRWWSGRSRGRGHRWDRRRARSTRSPWARRQLPGPGPGRSHHLVSVSYSCICTIMLCRMVHSG